MHLLFALTLRPQQAAPRLLIAPLAPEKKGGAVPSPSLGNHVAQELDDDGRTLPVVWGITDPIFRPLALDGKLGNVPDLPTRDQALGVARRLGAGWVLLYRTERKKGNLDATAELVQDGRTVWRDEKSMTVKLGNAQSDEDTAASVARTWVQLLTTKDGPLKPLPSLKALSTPDATPGQQPVVIAPPTIVAPPVIKMPPKGKPPVKTPPVTVPPITPPPIIVPPVTVPPVTTIKPATTDLDALDARLAGLMRAGRAEEARAAARDAVDADPLSPGPRAALVRLLAAQGDAAGAADEARRAADLLPGDAGLRTDAVRRLLAIGRVKEARDEANELRARHPDDPAARRLSAEVALAGGDAETAVRETEGLLKAGDDPQAHLLRGVARARLGGTEGAVADLKAWADATPEGSVRLDGYAFAERSLGAMAERAANGLLPLVARVAAQPKSGAVRDQLEEAGRQAQARAAAFAALPAMGPHHDDWALAHRLLALVTAEMRDFLTSGDEDKLTSARLDLGEAKRAIKEALGR